MTVLHAIHDSLLVGYSVNSETRDLILSLQPHQGSTPSPFTVVFHGTMAHRFEWPLLPAILFGITPVNVDSMLMETWPFIERGFRACGWPGPWADTLANAQNFARTAVLQAFEVDSSYGLSGWVLARDMEIRGDL
jgi:hypothetical protein